ncbi:MAG: nucleotidyltransferase family protein [Candidatus Omnitrophica bacterium]|nr:nucleotidyltransferase family protein [Candidatus Omnitrophota bacterium]
MLITFSGLDGAGKTTQIDLFTKYLKENNYRFKRITMYDDISTSASLRKLIGKRPSNSNSHNTSKAKYRYDKNRKGSKIVTLRKLTYLLDVIILVLKKIYYEKIRNYILIMDRYLYDSLANLFNTGSEFYTNFMLRIIPRPNLAILLDAKPEVAFERKPEYPSEFYSERRDAYLHVFKHVQTGAVIESEQGKIDDIQENIRDSFVNAQDQKPKEIDKYSSSVDFITRTLFGDITNIPEELSFENILAVLQKNRITVRWLQKMKTVFNKEEQTQIDKILNEEKIRLERALELIDKVTKEFEKRNLSIMVIKTLDNYPDLGHDVDLYTNAPIKDIDDILINTFKAKLENPTFSEKLAHKRNYKVNGYTTLEIHCSQLGQLGEDRQLAKDLIATKEKTEINGKIAYIPRPEYRIILCVLQRIYRHFNIRICDVKNTIDILNSNSIDWAYLRQISAEYGIWEGVSRYFSYTQTLSLRYNIRINTSINLMHKNWPTEINNRNMHFRFPLFSTGINTYSRKIGRDIISFNLYSLSRLFLILPLALVHFISVKLFGKSRVW